MAYSMARRSSSLCRTLKGIQKTVTYSSISNKNALLASNEAKWQPQLLFPSLSRLQCMSASTENSSEEARKSMDGRRRLLNRILYRSKQRGFLELDLVLGKWADDNIEKLDDNQLKSLTDVLDIENPDLWKWLTGQEVAPQQLTENPSFMEIHERIMGRLNAHSPSETRAVFGQPWVRGWDDNRKIGGPQVGNQ